MIGDFSDSEIFWMLENDRTLKGTVFNVLNIKKFFEILKEICRENDSILKRKIFNFVHCDPSKENIFILKDKSVKLIDWDFAGYHIFERDLALFIECYNLNEKQELLFLKAYGIKSDNNFMKKLNILKLILYAGDIAWLLSERKNSGKKIKKILNKCFKIIKRLEIEEKLEK